MFYRRDLLRRDLVGVAPHVDLDVLVEAGDDEEHPGPAGAAGQEAAQAKYHCSLVLLQDMS